MGWAQLVVLMREGSVVGDVVASELVEVHALIACVAQRVRGDSFEALMAAADCDGAAELLRGMGVQPDPDLLAQERDAPAEVLLDDACALLDALPELVPPGLFEVRALLLSAQMALAPS